MNNLQEKIRLFEEKEYGGKVVVLDKDSPDLTGAPANLPNGAYSVMVGSKQSSWQVFTEINYKGASATLFPGKNYSSPSNIDLPGPIKSMRVKP